jgi:hypothetical protein
MTHRSDGVQHSQRRTLRNTADARRKKQITRPQRMENAASRVELY